MSKDDICTKCNKHCDVLVQIGKDNHPEVISTCCSAPVTSLNKEMPSKKLKGKSKEAVNHPEHYNHGIEVIKFTNSWNLNFNRGSVVKYVCRAAIKDPAKEIEDLRKAKKYIDFEIQRLKELKNDN